MGTTAMSFTLIKPSTCFVTKTSSSSNPQRLRVFTLRCSSQVASSGITQPFLCIYQCIPFFFFLFYFFFLWVHFKLLVSCVSVSVSLDKPISCFPSISVQFPRFDSLFCNIFMRCLWCYYFLSCAFSGLAERPWKVSDARLLLEDGSGAQLGEVVFNTSLTG